MSRPGLNVERIGHRGAPRRFMENTLGSFQEALRLGADAIELDVHVTADGAVVVHHDATLSSRVTPTTFRRRPLGGMSSEEVASIDLGNSNGIPQLVEVLRLTRGRAVAYVEVKAGDVQTVIDCITESGAECALHSFDHSAIAEASRLAPGIPRGVLFDRWPKALGQLVASTGARDVWPKATLYTEARVAEIHALGCRAIAWTVNDASRARTLASWGLDGICTDDLTLL